MSILNGITQVITLIIALIALFGETNIPGKFKLNSLGKVLSSLILIVFGINIYAMIIDDQKKLNKELELIQARKSTYSKIGCEINRIKHAFLWEKYKPGTEKLDVIDYQTAPSVFIYPNEFNLLKINKHMIQPLKNSIEMLSDILLNNKIYLTFQNIDDLQSFLRAMKSMNIIDILSNYDNSNIEFGDYLIDKDLTHIRLKILFLHLHALEVNTKASEQLNMEQFYTIRSECRPPVEDDTVMFSCY